MMVEDIIELDEREKIIKTYHEKSVHRGITETLVHLRRKYYFPEMKNLITKIINNCEICSTNKYERNQKPLKF